MVLVKRLLFPLLTEIPMRLSLVAFLLLIASFSIVQASPAKNWLVSQQKSTGLIDSYEGDNSDIAWTYDEACAIIALTAEGDLVHARSLLTGMVAAQSTEGSWFDGY